MYTNIATLLAFAASVAAKPPSSSRTYAVDYFYGKGPLVEGRMDPIISPGNVSNHVHTVMGGSNFAISMDDNSALNPSCTTSKPKADGSNYWWPKLYFHDPNNGSFIDVDLYYAKVYYFSEPTDDVTEAFPPGLRMLTGDAMNRAPPTSKNGGLNIDSGAGDIQSVQFVCGVKSGANPWGTTGLEDPNVGGHGVGFPDANCDGYTTPLRYDLHFPSCYNPKAGPKDFKNNMAFPSSKGAKQGQNCPAGWTHTPHVFIEVYWNTPVFSSLWTPGQGKQPFVLASGDPSGFGLHGDFFSGWDQAELQSLIDGCDAGDSGFDKCPNIDANGGVNDSSGSCTIPPHSDEKIKGVMDQLPGCNPLQYGPGPASVQTANCGGSVTNRNTATSAAAPASTGPAGGNGSGAGTGGTSSAETSAPAATSSSSSSSPAALSPSASQATTLSTAASKPAATDTVGPATTRSSSSSSKTHRHHHPHHTGAPAAQEYVTVDNVVHVTDVAKVTKYVTA